MSRQDRPCRVRGCQQSFADCKHGFGDEERSIEDERLRKIVREEVARILAAASPVSAPAPVTEGEETT